MKAKIAGTRSRLSLCTSTVFLILGRSYALNFNLDV